MDIWNPVSSDNVLFRKEKEGNEYNANAADVVHNNPLEKRVVGHTLKSLSKTTDMLLSLNETRST